VIYVAGAAQAFGISVLARPGGSPSPRQIAAQTSPSRGNRLWNPEPYELGVLFCGNLESYARPASLVGDRGFFDTRGKRRPISGGKRNTK
jgi:hypothetical protein